MFTVILIFSVNLFQDKSPIFGLPPNGGTGWGLSPAIFARRALRYLTLYLGAFAPVCRAGAGGTEYTFSLNFYKKFIFFFGN